MISWETNAEELALQEFIWLQSICDFLIILLFGSFWALVPILAVSNKNYDNLVCLGIESQMALASASFGRTRPGSPRGSNPWKKTYFCWIFSIFLDFCSKNLKFFRCRTLRNKSSWGLKGLQSLISLIFSVFSYFSYSFFFSYEFWSLLIAPRGL